MRSGTSHPPPGACPQHAALPPGGPGGGGCQGAAVCTPLPAALLQACHASMRGLHPAHACMARSPPPAPPCRDARGRAASHTNARRAARRAGHPAAHRARPAGHGERRGHAGAARHGGQGGHALGRAGGQGARAAGADTGGAGPARGGVGARWRTGTEEGWTRAPLLHANRPRAGPGQAQTRTASPANCLPCLPIRPCPTPGPPPHPTPCRATCTLARAPPLTPASRWRTPGTSSWQRWIASTWCWRPGEGRGPGGLAAPDAPPAPPRPCSLPGGGRGAAAWLGRRRGVGCFAAPADPAGRPAPVHAPPKRPRCGRCDEEAAEEEVKKRSATKEAMGAKTLCLPLEQVGSGVCGGVWVAGATSRRAGFRPSQGLRNRRFQQAAPGRTCSCPAWRPGRATPADPTARRATRLPFCPSCRSRS